MRTLQGSPVQQSDAVQISDTCQLVLEHALYMRQTVTGGGKEFCYSQNIIKKNVMGGAYSMHNGNEKCIQNFSLKTGREETTWDT
jgi:hypothetical protein